MSEVLPPKRQAAVDRLRRRVEVYTKDHQDRFMHYERIGPALCEQQMQDSFALKQKYLDPKAKKTNSSSTKSSKIGSTKPAADTHATNTQSNKYGKRPLDDDGGEKDGPPAAKIQCTTTTTSSTSASGSGPAKFSVEIVQQLEFTASASGATSVSVKTLTNTSVKSETQVSPSSGGDAAPEMKKEKRCDTPDFMVELNGDSDDTAADLANLERFISEDTSDGIINADTFKDLISEIHDLPPEFMEDFDFDTEHKNDFADGARQVDSIVSRLKQEEVEAADREIQAAMLDIGKSMSMNSSSSTSTTTTLTTSTFRPFTGPELSPAALTLKQMAEQHQSKAQITNTGLSAPPTMANQGAPMAHPPRMQYRPPYSGYGPNSPMIKKEVPYFADSPGPGRPVAKSSPVPISQTSPAQFKAPTPTARTPPPPPSVQFNQTQQMNINGIQQMAATQHMQMTADVKVNSAGNVQQIRQQQVQQQQFYNQQQQQPAQQQQNTENNYSYSASQTQTINFTQQHLRGNTRMPASLSVQQQAAQQQQAMQQQQQQQAMMRMQMMQQQQQQQGMTRPPPPDYKTPQQQHMQQQQQQYPAANIRPGLRPMVPAQSVAVGRPSPSGATSPMQQQQQRPMMNYPQQQQAQGMMGMNNMGAYGGNNMMMNRPQQYNNAGMVRAQRPPNVTVGPDGMNAWRQQQMAAMQQQQQQQQQQPQQAQQMARFQQQQQQQAAANPNNIRMQQQQTYMQQQQTYMHTNNQGNMQQMTLQQQQMHHTQNMGNNMMQQKMMATNMQMQQQQQMQRMPQQQFAGQGQQFAQQQFNSNQQQQFAGQQHFQQQSGQFVGQQQFAQQFAGQQQQFNNTSTTSSANSDFSLEFLDNISSSDNGSGGGQFGNDAQELLNSFDPGMGFSLLDSL